MFGLNKYVEKIYSIQWKFSPKKQKDLEELLFVEFEQNENGYFVIKNILYSYIDILCNLEELSFIFTKYQDSVYLEIIEEK